MINIRIQRFRTKAAVYAVIIHTIMILLLSAFGNLFNQDALIIVRDKIDFMIMPLIDFSARIIPPNLVDNEFFYGIGIKGTIIILDSLLFCVFGGAVYFVFGYLIGIAFELRSIKRVEEA